MLEFVRTMFVKALILLDIALQLGKDVCSVRRHFCTLQLLFHFWKKLSRKALIILSKLLLSISKHEISQLAIVQGNIF